MQIKSIIVNADSVTMPIADNTIDCVVTSPPYFNLRDYGTGEWIGGNPECKHIVGRGKHPCGELQKSNTGSLIQYAQEICPDCGLRWFRNDDDKFQPSCDCGSEPVQDIVLDPFSGSGTTVAVARKLGRRVIGLDYSHEYCQHAMERTGIAKLLQWTA